MACGPACGRCQPTWCWLALVAWSATAEVHPGWTGRHLAVPVLLAVAGGGWLLWVGSRMSGTRSLRLPSWIMMAASGRRPEPPWPRSDWCS